jgi:glyoxylase-like metal-dependent hydrolase (beta-lactamase superfamily II)
MKQLYHGISLILGQGLDCNVFIIESNDESLLIDSGLGDSFSQGYGVQPNSLIQLERAIKERNIDQAVLTHGHLDHVGGIMGLQSKLHLKKIYASEIEAKYLKKGDSSFISPFFGSKCSPINITHELEEGDRITIGEYDFQVLHTPGHTSGSISLWEAKNKILVSGDTVFPHGSFGRTDLPSGSSKNLIDSLKRLTKLDVKILLPGHMPPSSSSSDATARSIKRSYEIAREMLLY